MKKLLLLALLPCSLIGYARLQEPSPKALDEKFGFRDVKLETDTTQLPGLKFWFAHDGVREYRRGTDNKSFGTTQLAEISYAFYKGKLICIVLSTKGLTNSRALLDALQVTYGQGEPQNQILKKIRWTGNKAFMTYKEDAKSDAMVMIWSAALFREQAADRQADAKKAAADL